MTNEQAAAIAGAMLQNSHVTRLESFEDNAARVLTWLKGQQVQTPLKQGGGRSG